MRDPQNSELDLRVQGEAHIAVYYERDTKTWNIVTTWLMINDQWLEITEHEANWIFDALRG